MVIAPSGQKKAMTTIFFIVFLDILGFSLILPLLPFIAESFGGNPTTIGFLVASYSFFQFIAAPILGTLSDRFGRRKLLIFSQIGSALGFIILGLAHTLPLLFLSRIIDGITGGNISIAHAYIADITTPKNRAKGMGMLSAAFGAGFIIGPAVGGFLSQISFSLPAYVAAAMALITALATQLFLKETVASTQNTVKHFSGLKASVPLTLAHNKSPGYLPLWA
ncbi:MAG: MFS transporter [Candidatus Chisholmbacteria bacterium]|nr:MFS transporter [Candidatus Chisholmbacteria bacterium]